MQNVFRDSSWSRGSLWAQHMDPSTLTAQESSLPLSTSVLSPEPKAHNSWCCAVEALCSVSAIDTLLSNFLEPLQGPAIATQTDGVLGRVHCSLNINTETGRLSARRPNLQNQPSGDKDIYHVRG